LSEEIEITLNGNATSVTDRCTVEKFVSDLELQGKQVAVELNGEIMSRGRWAETILASGDRVEIVHFVGGGGGE